ncbi:MAG: hypothetical protein LBQ92_01845, partial [Propionibacteriaceae bacterium]|nr:hypothetical protein [Propionibacteriaceae bacterium]
MKTAATLGLRYLLARGRRSLFTTLAVAIGVTLTFGLNSIAPSLQTVFERNLLSAAGKIDLTIAGDVGQAFAEKVADEVARVAGVAAVSPEV